MKRVFIIFPLAFIVLFAISPSKLFQEINSKESKNINKNIKRSKKNLTKTINQQGLMNKKLANIAKSIEKLL
ncbi:MAG: hypothetical protein GXO02_04600, partial [Epsilonproteobacteria bacterium]|nr:hypothetical protein [Campylobacterota bacterium]